MFTLPNAKRVRREDLYSSSHSTESSSDSESSLAGLVKTIFKDTYTLPQDTNANAETSRPSGPADDEEFEFRLFSTATSKHVGEKRKITLRSPSPEAPQAGRPFSYYIVPEATGERKRRFESTAVSGDEILMRAKETRWWGCELPWRVIKIPSTKGDLDRWANAGGKRKRPGKKRRIMVREKDKKAKEEREKKRKEEEEKEKAEREKRTRRNREKKVKRKIREKIKKGEKKNIKEGSENSDGESTDGDRSGQ